MMGNVSREMCCLSDCYMNEMPDDLCDRVKRHSL